MVKLRVLTKDDLGKCVDDVDVVAQPLYVVCEYDDVEVDNYDGLMLDIPYDEY